MNVFLLHESVYFRYFIYKCYFSVHVVFGEVVSGVEIISQIEGLETGEKSRPLKTVLIINCGELIRKVKGKFKSHKR